MTNQELHAFSNDDLGLVIAASSEEHAARLLLEGCEGLDPQDPEEVEGSSWSMLSDETRIRDEDGEETGESVGEAIRTLGKPGLLWVFEP